MESSLVYISKKKKEQREYFGILWILPALLLLFIFNYYPCLSAFYHSLTDWDGVNSNFVLFDNYIRLFQDQLFWKSCLNMIFLTVTCIFIGNLATIILAELIYNLKNKKIAAFFRFMFVIPAIVPGIVVIMLWGKVILSGSATGVVNKILSVFGIDPIGWFTDEKTVLLSIIIYGFPWMGGTSFLIYLAGLYSIPESVIDSTKLDGCGFFRRLISIDLPLLKGQLKYFLILGLIGGIQSFTLQYAITNGGPGTNYSSMVPGYYMYKAAINDSQYGYSCAIGTFLFVVIMIITIINNRIIKTSEN